MSNKNEQDVTQGTELDVNLRVGADDHIGPGT